MRWSPTWRDRLSDGFKRRDRAALGCFLGLAGLFDPFLGFFRLLDGTRVDTRKSVLAAVIIRLETVLNLQRVHGESPDQPDITADCGVGSA